MKVTARVRLNTKIIHSTYGRRGEGMFDVQMVMMVVKLWSGWTGVTVTVQQNRETILG